MKWQKNVVLKDKTDKFYDKRHRATRAVAPATKAVFTVRGLARTYLAALKDKIPDTFTNAAVDNQTRSLGSHTFQRGMRGHD